MASSADQRGEGRRAELASAFDWPCWNLDIPVPDTAAAYWIYANQGVVAPGQLWAADEGPITSGILSNTPCLLSSRPVDEAG